MHFKEIIQKRYEHLIDKDSLENRLCFLNEEVFHFVYFHSTFMKLVLTVCRRLNSEKERFPIFHKKNEILMGILNKLFFRDKISSLPLVREAVMIVWNDCITRELVGFDIVIESKDEWIEFMKAVVEFANIPENEIEEIKNEYGYK